MDKPINHWSLLLGALRQDATLQGHWSYKDRCEPFEIFVSSAFYETWIRLAHASLLAPLEATGRLVLKMRRPRLKPTRQAFQGQWNRFVCKLLEQSRDNKQEAFLLVGPAGSGKTFLTRSVLGLEHPIYSVKWISRRLGLSRRENFYQDFLKELVEVPLLVLDNVHHLFEYPVVTRWLLRLLDLRGPRPLISLARPGPGLDQMDSALKSCLSQGVQAQLEYPEPESQRHLARLFLLDERMRVDASIIHALSSRPLTPGRLLHVIRCLKTIPQSKTSQLPLVRELLRFAPADELIPLFKQICLQHGVGADEMRCRRRLASFQKARQEYAYMALQAGWRPGEVASILKRSPRSIQDLARQYGS